MEQIKKNKKILTGVVVSDKMEKTVVVKVEEIKSHPLYRKYIRKSNRFKVHDEKNICQEGDRVKIIECRPLSRHKAFRLLEIIQSKKRSEA